jgi:hypothetical protein
MQRQGQLTVGLLHVVAVLGVVQQELLVVVHQQAL